MEDLNRELPLFEGLVPFRLQSADRDIRQCDLTVRVLEGIRPSPRPTKVLCIEVTDDRDPFFLHSLTVGEAEFALLKEEQSILVDFNAFHAKFIELLNECLQSKATAQPRFYCVLAAKDPSPGSSSVLSVVETNQFKQLTHIQLGLRSGNDSSIKRYLSARLQQTQAALARTEKHLSEAQHEILSRKDAQARTDTELLTLRAELSTIVENGRRESKAALQSVKEEAAREQAAAEKSFREHLNSVSSRLEAQVAELRKRNDELVQLRTVGTTANAQLESDVRELQHQLKVCQSNLGLSQEEASNLRTSVQRYVKENADLHRDLASATTQVAVLNRHVEDLKETLVASQGSQKATEVSRGTLESSLAQYKESFARQHAKIEGMEQEIMKANQIIAAQQEELRAAKAKYKNKVELARSAEDQVFDRDRTITQQLRDIDALRNSLEREKADNAQLQQANSGLKQQLLDAKATVEKDQEVITWLNKQLTELSTQPVTDSKLRFPRSIAAPRTEAPAASLTRSTAAKTLDPVSQSTTGPLPVSQANNPVSGTGARSDASTNPYLSGTIPLSQALSSLKVSGKSAYFAKETILNQQIPGGGPLFA